MPMEYISHISVKLGFAPAKPSLTDRVLLSLLTLNIIDGNRKL